jgi:hypothetical protein
MTDRLRPFTVHTSVPAASSHSVAPGAGRVTAEPLPLGIGHIIDNRDPLGTIGQCLRRSLEDVVLTFHHCHQAGHSGRSSPVAA